MAKSPHYSGEVTKHQEYAQTGHIEGYARGGSVSTRHEPRESGGHSSMKHHNKGHGKHGHLHPHEHHTHPGGGPTGHGGHSVHSLVHEGKNTPEHTMMAHTHSVETDGGGEQHSHPGGTGTTRNRL